MFGLRLRFLFSLVNLFVFLLFKSLEVLFLCVGFREDRKGIKEAAIGCI